MDIELIELLTRERELLIAKEEEMKRKGIQSAADPSEKYLKGSSLGKQIDEESSDLGEGDDDMRARTISHKYQGYNQITTKPSSTFSSHSLTNKMRNT